MSWDTSRSPKELEAWLAAVSEVLATLLQAEPLKPEERERCKRLLVTWSSATAKDIEQSRFQVGVSPNDKVQGRDALPSLFRLIDSTN